MRRLASGIIRLSTVRAEPYSFEVNASHKAPTRKLLHAHTTTAAGFWRELYAFIAGVQFAQL